MSQDENAVNEVVETPTETVSAPVENKEVVEEKDVMDMSLDELDPSSTVSDAEEQSEVDAEETTQESPDDSQGEKPLAPKSENRFQKLANENRELKERLQAAESRKAQIATEQELLNEVNPETGDYFTPQEAERAARLQTLQSSQQSAEQESYNLQIQQNQESLAQEANQVTAEFPMFRELNPDGTKNTEYVPELATAFNDLLGENLVYELADGSRHTAKVLMEHGVNLQTQAALVGAYNSPFKLAKIIADATKLNTPKIQAQAQKATEKMLANADRMGGASQATKTKVDPLMEAFDIEASR